MHSRFADASEDELERARALAPALEQWFATGGRMFPWRRWRSPYRLLVVEILLQRTQAEAVANFAPFFFQKYPGWHALRKADKGQLVADLSALGLQGRRADVLLRLAACSTDRKADEGAPGVGQYIARAYRVATIGSTEAMVDSNFVRVLRRVFDGPWKADYRFDGRLQQLAQAIVEGSASSRAVNWAVLDLGALICAPRLPRCSACPIRVMCSFALRSEGNADSVGS